MRARGRLNLVLFCAAIALALWVMREPDEEASRASPKLAAIEPMAITRIQIEPLGQESVVLSKRDARWYLNQPMRMPADGSLAAAIAAVAATQSHAQLAVVPQRLQDFGLDPPRARLRLDDLALAFGDTEPLHGQRYVLIESTVHLIADQFFHYLSQPPERFVHPAPLGPQADPVALELPGLNLELIDQQWTVQTEGAKPPAHAVTALVGAWRRARASTVQKRDPTIAPQERIRIRLRGIPAPLDFEVGRRGQELLLVRSDLEIQYLLPAPTGERLLRLAPVTE
jgi:hypothetical protein